MWTHSSKEWESRSQTVSPSPWKHEGWERAGGGPGVPGSQKRGLFREDHWPLQAWGSLRNSRNQGPDSAQRLGLPRGWGMAAGGAAGRALCALGPGRSGHDQATAPEPAGCRPPHRSTTSMTSGSPELLPPAAPQPSSVPA